MATPTHAIAAPLAALEAGVDGLEGVVLLEDGAPRGVDAGVPHVEQGRIEAGEQDGRLRIRVCVPRCRTAPDLAGVARHLGLPAHPPLDGSDDPSVAAAARVLYGLETVATADLGTARDPVVDGARTGHPLGAWIRGRRDLAVDRPHDAARAFDALQARAPSTRTRLWAAHAWSTAGWPDAAAERVQGLVTDDPRAPVPLARWLEDVEQPELAARWRGRSGAKPSPRRTPTPLDDALEQLDRHSRALARWLNDRTDDRCASADVPGLVEDLRGSAAAVARAWETSPEPDRADRVTRLQRRVAPLLAEVREGPCAP